MLSRSIRLQGGRVALPKPSNPIPIRSCRRNASSIQRQERPQFAHTAPLSRQITSSGSKRAIEVNDPDHPVAQDYLFYQHQKERTADLGAKLSSNYRPHELISNPPWPRDVTLELLMASQSHLGHATSLWNPANAAYIFGIRGDHDPIHIISLDVTAAHLRRACKVVSGVTERGGLVLFVGTRAQQSSAVVRAAQLAKGCHLFNKWTPGSITNGQQILGNCKKKVVNHLDEEVLGFEDQLLNKAAIKPDLVVCLNPLENYVLLHECGIHNIPTIGIIDTDANPTWVTYPIPANDDSLRCVQLIAGVLGRAGQEGQQNRLAMAKEGKVSYPQTHGLDAPRQTTPRREPQKNRRRPADPAVTATQHSSGPDLEVIDVFDPTEDLDGVSVAQYAEDEALLQEAENAAYLEDDTISNEFSTRDSSNEAIYAEASEAADRFDAQFLDEDLPQQGGGRSAGSQPVNTIKDDDKSTWEQVESVEEELGEKVDESDSVPAGTPERGLDEEPGMMERESPSKAAERQDFGSEEDLEPRLEKGKKKDR